MCEARNLASSIFYPQKIEPPGIKMIIKRFFYFYFLFKIDLHSVTVRQQFPKEANLNQPNKNIIQIEL